MNYRSFGVSAIFRERILLLQQFLFELGADMGKPMLKPGIGYRPENSGHKLVAGVNASVYRALLKNKPPIYDLFPFFEVITSKNHKHPSVAWSTCSLSSLRQAIEHLPSVLLKVLLPQNSHNKAPSCMSIGRDEIRGLLRVQVVCRGRTEKAEPQV